MIKVHITDDHKMLIEGLTSCINESGVAEVIDTSNTLSDCRKSIAFSKPDILLLDINLPDGNGVDFCLEVKTKYPEVKILILTTHDEYSIARRVMNNGASGYILKNALSEEVIAGIEAVMNDEIFLCEEIDVLMNRRSEQPIWLTSREQELLKLLADGLTNQEIADTIFLSVETIKTYRKNLLLKMGAKNTIVAVRMAIDKKLI